jgi:hypothetical protein
VRRDESRDAARHARVAARAPAARPLSPWTYLLRNPRRVGPLFAIQVLVTSLLVLIITPTNAFRATAEASLRPFDVFTIVAARLEPAFDDDLLALLDRNPAQARRIEAKMFWLNTPMIVGEGSIPVLALPRDAWDLLFDRLDLRLASGHLPAPGTEEAVLHEAVVRARGMALGDRFGQLVDPQDSLPGRFTLVGTLAGEARVGLADYEYASRPFFVLARRDPFQIVDARPGRKAESDRWLHEAQTPDGEAAFDVVDRAFARQRVERWLVRLPLVIGFITISVAVVVAFVISLLNVIVFQVRVDEFGLYLALGHTRGALVRKLAYETGLVAFAAWLAGLALGIAGVWIYDRTWLRPNAIVMHVLDVRPFVASLSVPLLSATTGAWALARRLHRMDPVEVIQRRGT